MTPNSPTIQARHLVYQTLAELGVADPGPCAETVVVRDGFYVGRRFHFDEIQAVWLEPDGKIEIYDGQDKLIRRVALGDSQPLRRAA